MYWSGRREGGVGFSEGTQKYYITPHHSRFFNLRHLFLSRMVTQGAYFQEFEVKLKLLY
jgi:hypothetical protein